jgi:signal transduction histidine kinase
LLFALPLFGFVFDDYQFFGLSSELRVGNNVAFSFADAGVGMSEDTLQKLWTPLFTTKPGGMGLGLPICKRFVEAHGRTITVNSILTKGSTLVVTMTIRN